MRRRIQTKKKVDRCIALHHRICSSGAHCCTRELLPERDRAMGKREQQKRGIKHPSENPEVQEKGASTRGSRRKTKENTAGKSYRMIQCSRRKMRNEQQ